MTDLREKVARAIHDGPLLADDYDFDAPKNKKASDWCREVADAAISIVLEEAAKVADEKSAFFAKRSTEIADSDEPDIVSGSMQMHGASFGARKAAAAIRALVDNGESK